MMKKNAGGKHVKEKNACFTIFFGLILGLCAIANSEEKRSTKMIPLEGRIRDD